jgi:hypothetical protein
MNMKQPPGNFLSKAIDTSEKRDVMADDIIGMCRAVGIFMAHEDRAHIRASLDGLIEKIEAGIPILMSNRRVLTTDEEVVS